MTNQKQIKTLIEERNRFERLYEKAISAVVELTKENQDLAEIIKEKKDQILGLIRDNLFLQSKLLDAEKNRIPLNKCSDEDFVKEVKN